MTITHNGVTLASTLHGTPIVPPWEYGKSVQRFFGVAGQYQIMGAAHARTITIDYEMTGHATNLNLQAGIAQFAIYLGTEGTLTVNLGGGDSTSYTHCTFEGFFPSEAPWYDGSGTNGWSCRGQLRFTQRAGT